MSTYRYAPGRENTTSMSKERPGYMNPEEHDFYTKFFMYADHAVDNMDLLVLQNDEREPVLEMLVKLEGNTLQADLQCMVGQPLPNWDESRLRYTKDGHPYYQMRFGQKDKTRPMRSKSGLPKEHICIGDCDERMHMINVIKHLETTDENKNEARLRILRKQDEEGNKLKLKRNKLWQEREEQIRKHLKEELGMIFMKNDY